MIALRLIPDVAPEGGAPTVGPGASLRDAARAMREANAGGAAVVDDDGRFRGLVTLASLADAFARFGPAAADVAAADAMLRDLDPLAPDDSALDALELMGVRGGDCYPVLADGRPVAVIDARMLVTALEAELRRLYGELQTRIFGPPASEASE